MAKNENVKIGRYITSVIANRKRRRCSLPLLLLLLWYTNIGDSSQKPDIWQGGSRSDPVRYLLVAARSVFSLCGHLSGP